MTRGADARAAGQGEGRSGSAAWSLAGLALAPESSGTSVDLGVALGAGLVVAVVAYWTGRRGRVAREPGGAASSAAGPAPGTDRGDGTGAARGTAGAPEPTGTPPGAVLSGLDLVQPSLQLRLDAEGVVLELGGAESCVANARELGILPGVRLQDRLPGPSRGAFLDHLDELATAPDETRVRSFDSEFGSGEGASTYEVHLVQRPGVGLHVFAHDVSARRSEEAERQRLEERLRQAFKMEALGQLAGGMAHDFNNILTVITGHAQLLRMQLEREEIEHEDLARIDRASEEAARLTRQLLDFARTKELDPEWLDLNVLILRLRRLLDRLVRDDVALELDLSEDPWPVRADAGSLEQVLVNLALNAAEAMPEGGRLRIATRNVELSAEDLDPELDAELLPGRYVSLTLSDTGAGMSPEVRERAFEPFFTTKALGRGTGLGLASVYGIVRQSGGRIQLESEVGVGTTLEICLPASRAPLPQRELQPRGAGLGGTETILLCEDDEGVRGVMREALLSAGYRLLAADTPEEASAIEADFDDPLHLLITDVVMAGQTGGELAATLRERRPGLAVLYVSGYPLEVVERHGVLAGEGGLLPKPFTPRELLERVRRRLDREAPSVRR